MIHTGAIPPGSGVLACVIIHPGLVVMGIPDQVLRSYSAIEWFIQSNKLSRAFAHVRALLSVCPVRNIRYTTGLYLAGQREEEKNVRATLSVCPEHNIRYMAGLFLTVQREEQTKLWTPALFRDPLTGMPVDEPGTGRPARNYRQPKRANVTHSIQV